MQRPQENFLTCLRSSCRKRLKAQGKLSEAEYGGLGLSGDDKAVNDKAVAASTARGPRRRYTSRAEDRVMLRAWFG